MDKMIGELYDLLDKYKGETASNIGILFTETAMYLIENYEITPEQLQGSLDRCIKFFIDDKTEEADGE